MLRRAVGLPPLSVPRAAKEERFAERARARDEVCATVAAHCRERLGYARVKTLATLPLIDERWIVLVQCGYLANPDLKFAVVIRRGVVEEDGMEEREYWERKGELNGKA